MDRSPMESGLNSFRRPVRWAIIFAMAVAGVPLVGEGVGGADPASLVGLRGGLVVQLGGSDSVTPAALSRTGRYVVQVVDTDARVVETARKRFHLGGRYGLVTAAHMPDLARLPYCENLVNLVIVRDFAVSAGEIWRVLVPGGTVVGATGRLDRAGLRAAGFESIAERGGFLVARKGPCAEMDEWSHPRHDAGGNAVSSDTLVGPPERVRWIAAATREIEGLVTAGGRNFYGGVLARDSFNGLRLWHMDLRRGERDGADFELPRLSGDRARPIASAGYLYAVLGDDAVAIDAGSGEIAREFSGVGRPRELVNIGDTVIAADEGGIVAFPVEKAEAAWRFEASHPRQLVAGNGMVVFLQGSPPNVWPAGRSEAVALDIRTGRVRWRTDSYPWLSRVTRIVLHDRHLAFEVSTLDDHDAGNALHLISPETGKEIWEKAFPPGMNHRRQARAMFVDKELWILHGGKTNTLDKDNAGRVPIEVSSLDLASGDTRLTHPAGLAHCFPPVASPRFIFAGVLDMTDLRTGEIVANRITKAHCSTENGWVPANGLIYTTPKHCTCWPLLRGYVALAPARPDGKDPARLPIGEIRFPVEQGPAFGHVPAPRALNPDSRTISDWPMYRRDAWRSGSTPGAGPKGLGVIWSARLTPAPDMADHAGPVLHDWRENPFVKGPVSAPVVASGMAFVTRPDAHEILAIDAGSGGVRWRFTADGRIDTPPAIHGGLCLFGTHGGSVYALRADSGTLVWRLRVAPHDEQIVAYGQLESPWPVPGAILVMDDVAYFVAGRQSFADGGVFVVAVDPLTGKRRWAHRIDTVPQDGYYENSALEFDPVDILHREGDGIAMSRWILSRDGKGIHVDKWNAFAKLDTGGGAAWVPRGFWTYGARHQHRFPGEASRRPLVVFRDGVVFGALDGSTELFRRDFDRDGVERFSSKWITGWEATKISKDGGKPYRAHRVAEGSRWATDPFASSKEKAKPIPPGTQLYNDLHALALAGDGRLFAIHKDGRLKAIATADGSVLAETRVPEPAWDGLAIADGRLYLTTQTGELLCLGDGDR